MKKYEKYKSSGVEWIGEIPEHWNVNKFSRIAFYQEGPGLRNWQFTDKGVKVICVTNITEQGINFDLLERNISEEEYESSYQHFTVSKGDYLLASSGASWGKVAEYKGDEKVILNTSTIRLNTKDEKKLRREFLKWIIKSPYINENLNILLTGSCQPNFGPTHLSQLFAVYPSSIAEQTAITNFLDEKTVHIDKLIANKQELIKLLKEERGVIINEAVIRGINKNSKLKPSGIELIGDIPKHWLLRRISTYGKFSKGKGIKKDETKDVGLPCIRYGEIYTKYDRIVYKPISCIDEETSKNSSLIKKGNVLLAGSGETVEDIGKAIVYFGDEDIYAGGDIIIMRLNKEVDPIYASYLMNASFVQYQKAISGRGQIIVHIYPKDIREIITPLPPVEEQKEIVEYLDQHTKEIVSTISKIEREIELMRDYKKSLISEVVTGKIKVI